MKSGVVAGATAGLVGGIVCDIAAAIVNYAGLYQMESASLEYAAVANIVLSIIFGAIFGAIYSRFHDKIPGIGVSKGLCFGLMIWLIKDICAGSYVSFAVAPGADIGGNSPIWFVFLGFFIWIAYGPVLGVLYKK